MNNSIQVMNVFALLSIVVDKLAQNDTVESYRKVSELLSTAAKAVDTIAQDCENRERESKNREVIIDALVNTFNGGEK